MHRLMRQLRICLVGLLFVAAACSDDSDVGDACPEMVVAPSDTSGSSAGGSAYPASVEINTEFPCDALTCVASSGQRPYCSRECNADENCPSAFECGVVTDVGPLSNRRYCKWRGCRAPLECGDISKYECVEGNYGPIAPPGLCAPIRDDDETSTEGSSRARSAL